MSDSNIPKSVDNQQDDEAADLLMLFSTQSQKLNKDSATPTITTKTTSEIKNTESKLQQSKNSNVPLPSVSKSKSSSVSSISSNQMDRRDSSISREHSNTMRIDSITKSPGPASAALASGNNTNNKAIVAAAALAAAAATPLPILHKSTNDNQLIDNQLIDNIETERRLDEPIILSNKNNSIQSKTNNENISVKIEKQNLNNNNINKKNNNNKIKDENKNELPSYAVGPDAGIISCVCEYDHDDGLTIQCDKCFRWQHLICMGFESITDTPDDFQCNLCNENLHVDASRAKKLQENYLREEKSQKRKNQTKETNKDVKKNIGAAQFKKRKLDDNLTEVIGIDKYKTLYYPIDYFVFKSSPIKSLFNQLPEILKQNNSVLKIDKSNFNKILLNTNNLNIKSATENVKVKFTGISKLGLYTNKAIKENNCISLLSGEIDTKQNYMLDKVNKYWLLGCPKPNVFFHPDLPIIIDERGLGNYTRFIRKSCKPNSEIRTIFLNKNEIGFGIFSIKEIKIDQEITLPWEWDNEHPILKIINNSDTFDSLTSDLKMTLINSIQSILDLTDCACLTSECIINKIKKSSAYLQRNTRKNNISNLSPTPNQKYIPINTRYQHRLDKILNQISKDDSNNPLINSTSLTIEQTQSNETNNSIGEFDSNPTNDTISIDTENINNNINNINEDFKFKPKSKTSLYKLHILPKKFELIKKYSNINNAIEITTSTPKNEIHSFDELDINLPVPIEVNARILQKLDTIQQDSSMINNNKEFRGSTPGAGNEIRVEEKPKIVKKFSLADYKKKKTG
jgi:hypothetical protein